MVHGEAWTLKEFFVYPNEYIYWSIQIVMYPFMTGLVAGAFVLSSLYHVFGVKQLKDLASNARQVERLASVGRSMGREPMSPREARALLHLAD